jgi:hypothetical protein
MASAIDFNEAMHSTSTLEGTLKQPALEKLCFFFEGDSTFGEFPASHLEV